MVPYDDSRTWEPVHPDWMYWHYEFEDCFNDAVAAIVGSELKFDTRMIHEHTAREFEAIREVSMPVFTVTMDRGELKYTIWRWPGVIAWHD